MSGYRFLATNTPKSITGTGLTDFPRTYTLIYVYIEHFLAEIFYSCLLPALDS